MSNVAAVGRHVRALRLLTCLQNGDEFNTKELASRLSVSRRTIFRDLKLIRDSGIRIFFDEQHGTYRLPRTAPSDSLSNLTEEDLCDLALATHLSLLNLVPEYQQSLEITLQRLLGRCPASIRPAIDRLLHTTTLHWNGRSSSLPFSPQVDSPNIRTTLEAIRAGNLVAVAYRGDGNADPKIVRLRPSRVELSFDGWLLVGNSQPDGQLETIPGIKIVRVEHIVEVERMRRPLTRTSS